MTTPDRSVTSSTTGETNSVRGGWAFGIISVVTVAIVLIVYWAIATYDTPAEATALVAAVVGPLAGLGAAAFGVQLQATAKQETARTKDEANTLASALDQELDALSAGAGGTAVRGGRDDDGDGRDTVARLDDIRRRLWELGR